MSFVFEWSTTSLRRPTSVAVAVASGWGAASNRSLRKSLRWLLTPLKQGNALGKFAWMRGIHFKRALVNSNDFSLLSPSG
jgi:hypothetical protein